MKLIHRIKVKLLTKNGKVLFSNFMYLSLLQVASYLFPLFTLPYLARVIGVGKFGEIAFAQAVIVWFQTFVDYGFIYSAVRDIARCKSNLNHVSHIYTNVMWARLLLVLISFIFLIGLIILIPLFYEKRLILFLTFFIVVGQAIFPDWLFQAFERMKYVTILNVLIKLLFTVLVFIFIKEEQDYLYQPVLMSLGYIVSGLISIRIISKWGIHWNKPNLFMISDTIRRNTSLFINQIIPNLYSNLSVILLGFFYGQIENGILDVGRKFVSIAISFMMILSRTFYPFLSRNISRHNLFFKLNLLVSFVMTIILFFFSQIIIDCFFTSEFRQAVIVLKILSFSIVFQSLINIYGTNYLIINGYEKETRNVTLVASVVGGVLTIPCTFYYGYIGVAAAITFSTGLMAFLMIMEYRKVKSKK